MPCYSIKAAGAFLGGIMPTPLRVSYPGAVYHVMGRGNDKVEIFKDDADRVRYLDLLESVISECQLKIFAYALMSNHVHLFLRTEQANISAAMYQLNINYSLYFNRRHGRTGHLFGNRFKSKLVETDRYFLALLRYVHVNPVKAGLAASPEKYKWSGHRAYLGSRDRIITDANEGLEAFGPDIGLARLAYLEFLAQPIPDKELKLLETERNGILGGREFRETLKKAPAAF